MADFHVDLGDCAFHCGGIGGCYDKNTTGLGGDDSEVLEFNLKGTSGGSSIER